MKIGGRNSQLIYSLGLDWQQNFRLVFLRDVSCAIFEMIISGYLSSPLIRFLLSLS